MCERSFGVIDRIFVEVSYLINYEVAGSGASFKLIESVSGFDG